MNLASIVKLVGRDIRRTRGALSTAGFGILAGTAALLFFMALGLGVRAVLLGDVFPLDQLEFEPRQRNEPGLLALVLGASPAPSIEPEQVEQLRQLEDVVTVFPKLRFAFPASARGGADLFGYDVGTSELMGDGVEPELVHKDVQPGWVFDDPLKRPGGACVDDAQCTAQQYCERGSGEASGRCSDPVPVLVSRYLVEIFNKGIAPAHNLPAVGETLLARAHGVTFNMRIGESLLGRAKQGAPRNVRARIVGVSSRAMDLGVTLPIETVRRWNREYAGERSASAYSAALVELRDAGGASNVIDVAARMAMEPKDTRARDVSVMVNGVMALLSLVALVILVMAAANIAYTFRALLWERRVEIGLYRAVGATKLDIQVWQLALAAVVGLLYATAALAVGWLAAQGADWMAATRLPDFPFKPASFFSFPAWLLLGTVIFGVLFAVVGAFGAARRAASTDPRESLIQPG